MQSTVGTNGTQGNGATGPATLPDNSPQTGETTWSTHAKVGAGVTATGLLALGIGVAYRRSRGGATPEADDEAARKEAVNKFEARLDDALGNIGQLDARVATVETTMRTQESQISNLGNRVLGIELVLNGVDKELEALKEVLNPEVLKSFKAALDARRQELTPEEREYISRPKGKVTVAELQALCDRLGVSREGTKAQILERLRAL